MAEEFDTDTPEAAKGLRGLLEAAKAESSKALKELHAYKVKDVLAEAGLHLVKAEDLAGVDLKDVASKAATIQAERVSQEAEVTRRVMKNLGMSDEQIETAVTAIATGNEVVNEAANATARTRQLSTVGTPSSVSSTAGLHGLDAIRAGMKTT